MAYLGDPARYFVIHHSAADTVERIAPEEVSKAAAAIAAIAYAVAEMPERFRGRMCPATAVDTTHLISVSGDVEDSCLAWRVLPLHEDGALIRAFDDARLTIVGRRHEQADRPVHAEEA